MEKINLKNGNKINVLCFNSTKSGTKIITTEWNK